MDTLDDFIARRGFDREEVHREADVAERMGISQARVSELESGDVSSLKVSTLMRYAEALGGTFEAIIQIGDKTIRLA